MIFMIKINLLHEKKSKKAPPGQQQVLLMLLGLLVMGGGVYVLVHKPLADEVEVKKKSNADLDKQNRAMQEGMKDFEEVKKQAEAARLQAEAIKRLNNAKVVPAWFLHELGQILTPGRGPTMSTALSKTLADENRQYDQTWDPSQLWIDSIDEKDGNFTLKGGAQSDRDVTELALRMQSSIYFQNVSQKNANLTEDQKTKVKYYKFEITGKVVY